MTVEEKALKQTIVIDVMPLVGGHLPLPAIRLSKYSSALFFANWHNFFSPGTFQQTQNRGWVAPGLTHLLLGKSIT